MHRHPLVDPFGHGDWISCDDSAGFSCAKVHNVVALSRARSSESVQRRLRVTVGLLSTKKPRFRIGNAGL